MTMAIDRGGTARFRRLPAVACACALLLAPDSLPALSPESPEVREAVSKGIKFLETQTSGGLGVKALVGLTLAKNGAGPEHPQVKDAVAVVQAAVRGGPENFREDIYSTGVAIMFLVAVNPKQYHYDIETLVKSLYLRQKPDGAWGYPLDHPHGKTCDTSMTQFAVLGLWEAADQAELPTDQTVWDRVAEWLLRTQDPNGAFGYQGTVSGSLGERVKQSGPTHSMTVAGLCSVYISKDQLGLSQLRRRSDDDTPAALKPFETKDEARARVKTKLDPRLFAKARSDGNHWMSDNFTIEKPQGFLHYYLYALERYETFRQMESGSAVGNQWYDRGARFLINTQAANGSWESQAKNPPDTCFALLFLLRSTKKSLDRSQARFREAILAGGRGVPAGGQVRLRHGNIVVKPAAQPLDELVPMLEDPDHPRHAEALEALMDLAETLDPSEAFDRAARKRQGELLLRLADARSRQVRLAAVQALARSRDLDQVPALIERLSDADVEVALAARDGLAAISRRLDGFGLDLRGSAAARQQAIERWKAWYRSVRPDAALD